MADTIPWCELNWLLDTRTCGRYTLRARNLIFIEYVCRNIKKFNLKNNSFDLHDAVDLQYTFSSAIICFVSLG